MGGEGLVLVEEGCNLPPALRAEAQINSHHPFEYFHLLRKRDPSKGEEIEDDYAGCDLNCYYDGLFSIVQGVAVQVKPLSWWT